MNRRRRYLDFTGPEAATLFHRLLGLIFLDAWLSLGVQVRVLIGSHGLLPLEPFLRQARPQLSFFDFPTLLWLDAHDGTLIAGVIIGVLLSLLQLTARWPRIVAALQTLLYLSYVTAGRTFFTFQWDNLLLECGFAAMFLPRDRRALWIHSIFRLILFKLYWESGLAKFQSGNHDWRLGTAMAWYYETAPLPTALAWYLHHLPAWWHRLESWFTLAFELGVPFAIFAPRRIRLAAAAILTTFQIVNIATANYGFFAYLAITLHVFLLDERDIVQLQSWLKTRLRLNKVGSSLELDAVEPPVPRWREWLRVAVAIMVSFAFVSISTIDALINFSGSSRVLQALLPWRDHYVQWRVINSYHLFRQITTQRLEAEFQTSDDANTWNAHELWHKPGDPRRRPDWVAPHQPRVDFQLWFYGLRPQHAPEYVEALVARLCHDPAAVQTLFRDPLPPRPRFARIAFWRYHFTTPEERRRDGSWWKRTLAGATAPLDCAKIPSE